MNNTEEHTRVCKAIVKAIRDRGGFAKRIHASPYQEHGLPDIWCCLNGLFLVFEVKTGEGRPEKMQLIHQQAIRKSGGVAGIVRSVSEAMAIVDDLLGVRT